MIYEKLKYTVDIDQLKFHLQNYVLSKKPMMVSAGFGGWSVLSATGEYTDGWSKGEQLYNPLFMPGTDIETRKKALGLFPLDQYTRPTEICHGYLSKVITDIQEMGLNPMRARLSILKAQSSSSRHKDGEPHEYAVRLHIPIITNQQCTFATDDEQAHLPADGSVYVLHVNRWHQVFNKSQEDRIHLIMSIRDTSGVTQFHQYPKNNIMNPIEQKKGVG